MNKEHTDLHGLYHMPDVKLRTCREGVSEGAVCWVPAFQRRNKSPQVWMQRTVMEKLLRCANGSLQTLLSQTLGFITQEFCFCLQGFAVGKQADRNKGLSTGRAAGGEKQSCGD